MVCPIFWGFVFVPIFVLIFVFAFVFQTERVPAGAGRTLLVSSLSQFKIKSIFHRSTPTQSHTPMFTKLNPNIYKWMKSYGRFHMPQNGANPHFTFKRAISRILFHPSFLGPRGPLVEPSISPVPSRNNFSWVHRWVTLPSDLRDPSNHTFSESPWCQLSKFGRKYKYKDKYTDKYKYRDK